MVLVINETLTKDLLRKTAPEFFWLVNSQIQSKTFLKERSWFCF